MRILLIFVFIIASALSGVAQTSNEGHVRIINDSRLDTLMKKYIETNTINPDIHGWRIEIYFEAGNYSKKQAMEAKSEFVENHPEVPAYVLFQQPYYKVRVGDFRTKMEAEKFLKEYEDEYPNAFVVTDEINFPKLN